MTLPEGEGRAGLRHREGPLHPFPPRAACQCAPLYVPPKGGGMDKALQGCLSIAQRQEGLVTIEQTTAWKLTRRRPRWLLDTKRWSVVFPGVYRVVGAPETFQQRLRAVNLWLGHGFALSHETAGALHRFPDFFDGPIVATVTRCVRPMEGVKLHRVQVLPAKDIASVAGLRVTSVSRTLLDLAGALHAEPLRACINDALRFKRTTLDRIEATLERSGPRSGIATLREQLDEFRGGRVLTQSELERRVLAVLDDANFPRPDQQTPIFAGGRLRRMDFTFSKQNLVIEADGYAYHSGIDVFEDDRRRNNGLMSRGVRVLHWTWKALHERPEHLVAELSACLSPLAAHLDVQLPRAPRERDRVHPQFLRRTSRDAGVPSQR
ncbi:MAG: hypothetical protein ACO1OB_33915 [Archangium sp.]